MVCPLCGRKSEVGMFCSDCYLKKNLKLELPGTVSLTRCKNCGTYLLAGKWLRDVTEEDAVKRTVLAALKSNVKGLEKAGMMTISTEPSDKDHIATVTFTLGETEVSKNTIVRITGVACPDCSRMAGGYFEAVLQIRGGVSKKTIDDVVKSVSGHKDKFAFIAKIAKVPGGYDVYLGSKKSAERLVKGFRGAEVKKSFKQAGFDKQAGKSKHRFYYLVRV